MKNTLYIEIPYIFNTFFNNTFIWLFILYTYDVHLFFVHNHSWRWIRIVEKQDGVCLMRIGNRSGFEIKKERKGLFRERKMYKRIAFYTCIFPWTNHIAMYIWYIHFFIITSIGCKMNVWITYTLCASMIFFFIPAQTYIWWMTVKTLYFDMEWMILYMYCLYSEMFSHYHNTHDMFLHYFVYVCIFLHVLFHFFSQYIFNPCIQCILYVFVYQLDAQFCTYIYFLTLNEQVFILKMKYHKMNYIHAHILFRIMHSSCVLFFMFLHYFHLHCMFFSCIITFFSI